MSRDLNTVLITNAGVTLQTFTKLQSLFPGGTIELYSALVLARRAATWAQLREDVACYMGVDLSLSHLERRVKHFLRGVRKTPISNPKERHRFALRCAPNVRFLIDTVPVRCSLSADHYNGKYKCKVRKFQVTTDVAGNILFAKFGGTRGHDSPIYAKMGCGMQTAPGEVGIGDKAYIAYNGDPYPAHFLKSSDVCPLLTSLRAKPVPKGDPPLPIPDCQQNFDKYLQIVRSPVERAFSRLQKWKFIRCCLKGQEVTEGLVHLVCVADRIENPQVASDHVIDSVALAGAPRWKMPPPPNNVIEHTAMTIFDHANTYGVELRGRNSKNRGHGSNEFKGTGQLFVLPADYAAERTDFNQAILDAQ